MKLRNGNVVGDAEINRCFMFIFFCRYNTDGKLVVAHDQYL